MNGQTGQQLIDAFFKALGLVQLAQCRQLLHALEELARQAPEYLNWHTYLTGIMANELEHDWAKGQRIFTALLATDLEPAIHGRVLIALGRTYDYQGCWREALNVYEQCLKLFSRDDQVLDRVKIWKNMAITLEKGFTQSDFREDALYQAITYCRLALETLQASAHPREEERWLEATTWNTLGLIYRNLADWPQAIRCFERRIALGHALNNRYGVGMASNNLAEVLQHQGREKWPEALQAYLEARRIYREFGDTYQEIDVVANLAALYRDMGDLAAAHAHYRQAIDLIEDLRAGVSAEAARAGFFATVAHTYANAVLLCLEAGQPEQAFDYVEQARSRAFLDLLAARSPDLSEKLRAATMSLAEVQAALPEEGLLLEYFTTGLIEVRERRAAAGPARRHRFPPARTLIFAVTREALAVYDVGLSPNDLQPGRLDSAAERHFLQPAIRRALYDQLIAPVAGLVQGRRRLYLAPHGPLHYIPFQALTDPEGRTLLREGGPQIVYAPSATFLFRHGRATPGRASAPCLAIGYNGDGTTRLHFAEEEARGIARLLGGHTLTGTTAKRAALYDQARQYRILHISCHGVFDPRAPLNSALHLAPGEDLTALDVLDHLRLGSDLVTLSACESGLSRVRRGDELTGLMRAFVYAGTPALICTLWRVDERSTRILMERFYQQVQGGTGFAEALKCAQLYLMNLTRKEALELLISFMADEVLGCGSLAGTGATNSPARPAPVRQAGAYLKGLPAPHAPAPAEALLAGPDDERIFADPYYWAPFILIGEQVAGS
jgi:CHAT domain-containing protein/tetratricopeptide (TPR) repeat protein